jgi:hypothetical protein
MNSNTNPFNLRLYDLFQYYSPTYVKAISPKEKRIKKKVEKIE